LLPRRWLAERTRVWAARFRRLARDDERLPKTVSGLQFVAFASLMLHRFLIVAVQSRSQVLSAPAGPSARGSRPEGRTRVLFSPVYWCPFA
jgi:hypothetical protein